MCEYLDSVLHSWRVTVPVLLVLAAAGLYMLRRRDFMRKVMGHLPLAAAVVWFFGFILYWRGFNVEGCAGNALALFMRSALSSIEMFVSHSDLIEVGEELKKSHLYMTLFSLVHFCAVLCSAAFLVQLVSLSVGSRFRLRRCLRKGGDFHVFWNCPEKAKMIDSELNGGYVVLVQNDMNAVPEMPKRFTFSHLLGLGDVRGDDFVFRPEVTSVFRRPEKALEILRGAGNRCRLKFLFLSEDEQANIRDCEMVKALFKDADNVECCCHAAETAANKLLGIRLVDSSYLSALELRSLPEAQPVNYVERGHCPDGKPDGTVTSGFNALVVGFGETGRRVFDFLYETSAFIGPDGDRSPYRLTAVDRDMALLGGTFLSERPALKSNRNLEFCPCDTGAESFWTKMDELVGAGLKYVVVTLGNDMESVETALSIYYYMKRSMKDDRFSIYVRVRGDKYDGLLNKFGDGVIRFFGREKDVFSVKMLFDNVHRAQAEVFARAYCKASGENYVRRELPYDTVSNCIRSERKLTQNMANAYHVFTKVCLLTDGTMSAEVLDRLDALERKAASPAGDYVYVDEQGREMPYESALMTTLAKYEHLRWNAAVENLGYTVNEDPSRCDDLSRKHNCLVSWDDLARLYEACGTEYRQYDYNVVKTSIELYLDYLQMSGKL